MPHSLIFFNNEPIVKKIKKIKTNKTQTNKTKKPGQRALNSFYFLLQFPERANGKCWQNVLSKSQESQNHRVVVPLEALLFFFFYCCSSTVVSISPASFPPTHPSPPPTLYPTPLWLCPCVLYTCSWKPFPLFFPIPLPPPLWFLSVLNFNVSGLLLIID